MEKPTVYNCIIDEVDETTGIYAMSFVDFPANEVDFVALSKAREQSVQLNRDNQKQVLTGVVLRPEQLIYRYSPETGEYYIKFSAPEIEKISQKMMKTGLALNCTTHQHDQLLSGNYLTELWIVENPSNDKSNALGFKDLPKGTLMCSYKIEDASYWQKEVMSGNVKGFSLEGFFNQVPINIENMSKKKKTIKLSFADKLYLKARGLTEAQFSEIEKIEKDDTTDSGDTVIEFVLEDGGTVIVDEDGLATLNDETMQAGNHALADGNTLVIDESGKFVETKEASAKSDDPEETTAKQTLRKQRVEIAKLKRKLMLEENKEDKTDTETIADLKKTISEMQTIINDLSKALEGAVDEVEEAEEKVEEAKGEIAELKKVKPSTPPATQKKEESVALSQTDRVASVATSMLLQRKRK